MGDSRTSRRHHHRITWAGTSNNPRPTIRRGEAVEDDESGPRGCTGARSALWALRKVYMRIGQVFSSQSRVCKTAPFLPWPASFPSSTRRRFLSNSCIMSLIHRLYLFILLNMPRRYTTQAGRLFEYGVGNDGLASSMMVPPRHESGPDSPSGESSSAHYHHPNELGPSSEWEHYITTRLYCQWKMAQYVSTLLIPYVVSFWPSLTFR